MKNNVELLVSLARLRNIRSISLVLSTGVLFLVSSWTLADPEDLAINNARAVFNYQMHCQGCHTPDGIGGMSVPDLRGEMGNFLQSQAGREYLVRVPGSANSVLSDEQLAEVLNWMLLKYAGASLSEDWRPYNAEEVGEYRSEPLYEVVEHRRNLIADFSGN
ncbi:MAG: cytochrome c [Halioglobus sp.]